VGDEGAVKGAEADVGDEGAVKGAEAAGASSGRLRLTRVTRVTRAAVKGAEASGAGSAECPRRCEYGAQSGVACPGALGWESGRLLRLTVHCVPRPNGGNRSERFRLCMISPL